ncbi:hypothetical protein DASC09_000860 [Saccharomycopsis crataegensis]|uniref:Uncharacterized protein n=1 Tax=Saccharomycopsis crataegensis TaxID=43959 RepID=A0AAV5QDX0_9ASCO|nr:hypothetical protein DASC09_000860 [Saccharomycopsis crataegensis]
MVLHNNKWDRRAKYKYMKKHGLLKKQQEQLQEQTQEKEQDQQSGSQHAFCEEEIILKESNEDSDTNQENLEGNSPALLQDDMLLQSDEEDKDDEEFLRYARLTKNIKHSYNIEKKDKEAFKIPPGKKLEELDFDSLAKLDLGSSGDEDEHKFNRPTKQLSQNEAGDFEELQKKIEKDKLFRKIKSKFATNQISSNYENNPDEEKFEVNLEELLGSAAKLPTDKTNKYEANNDIFSMDFKNIAEKQKEKPRQQEKQKRKAIKRTENIDNEEKLLDDLLGL